MKRILFSLLMTLSLATGACVTGSVQTEQPVASAPPQPTATPLPSATLTSTTTPTASPTPIFTLDPSGYDPDIFPAGVVEHQPPLIARSDETVMLAFWLFDTVYCEPLQRSCQMEARLYYSYGEGAFQSRPLVKEIVDGLEQWVLWLPAADQAGKSLRYYAEFSFPEAGYTQRYPTAGTIDLFTASSFTPVGLPAEHPVEPGDKVYKFYWGYGPNAAHTIVQGHIRIGPPALDVASDGRIALLNPVEDGVLIYDPKEAAYSSFPLPFHVYPDHADIAFDQDDQLMVCDFNGKERNGIPRMVPYCYRLLPDGTIGASGPVYANFPIKLTEDLGLLDRYDHKSITPFNARGEANSREAQREKETWELPYRFISMTGSFDFATARFADIETGAAFEVRSDSGMVALFDFERTPAGYLMLFSGAERIRAVWIDPAGLVLKDVTLPSSEYSVLSFGKTAVAQDGSLYVMSATQNGIEIHFEEAPQR